MNDMTIKFLPKTLADLIHQLNNDETLSPIRHRDLCSDLKCIARLLNRKPSMLPADIKALKRVINELHPAQLGLSQKRLQNIRASLMFVFQRYQVITPVLPPLSPAWQSLFEQLVCKRERDSLTSLFRYCSFRCIAAPDVSDAVTASWVEWMETETLRKKTKALYRQACKVWNEIHDRDSINALYEQPLQRLSVPDNRTPGFALPWSEFNEGFVADIEAHLHWLSGKDLFSLTAPANPLKQTTIDLRKQHLHLLASAAVLKGYPIADLNTLSDLVCEAGVRAALGYYLDKFDGQNSNYLRDLTKTLVYIAQYWVEDEDQLQWIKDLLRRMGSSVGGLTEKNRHTLRQFEDSHNLALLLNLPGLLVEQAEKSHIAKYRVAIKVQLALAIELLLVAPMRVGNLVALRIDSNISYVGRGQKEEIFISIHESDVKNAIPLEYPLPDSARDLLNRYLKKHRPHLIEKDEPWLFPGKGEKHKQPKTLTQQIQRTVFKETGLEITPHQFRHLAAKLYLDQNPGNYELVRRVLGHKSIKTTTNFYTGMETRSAVKHFDETLSKLRASLPQGKRCRKGRV